MDLPPTPITTVEYHTAGEPFRIVTGGVPMPGGSTVLDRRSWSQAHLDTTRAFLVNEPRGHADMYGGFVTDPDDADGDLGVVFFHKDGFSTACGHGTIALVTWALDSERIERGPGDAREVIVDVPSGRLRTVARLDDDGTVAEVRFWNVPSFVSAAGIEVGSTAIDVAFGGAFYGSVALDDGPLAPEADDLGALIDLAREIRTALAGHPATVHPGDDRLSGLYGVTFHTTLGRDPLHQRNVTVFADGEVDRSPCGSGTSARLALLHHHGTLGIGDRFVNEGIAGGRFDGRIESIAENGGRTEVVTSVAGSAHRTGECRFTLDPRDQLGIGFQLR